MMCCTALTRKVPLNYCLLFLFTICEAYLVAGIASAYRADIVLEAMLMTSILVISLTLFAWCTPFDMVLCGPALILCILMALCMSLLLFFVFTPRQAYSFYIGLGILLYGIYLVMDTQLIMGGRHMELEIDDYVLGAVILYTDIIMIFLYILRFMGKK
jgi:protein lifeguard